jgi:hypothetical protein
VTRSSTEALTSKQILIRIVFAWLVWRIFLQLLVLIVPLILPYQPSFPYSSTLITSGLLKQIFSWANFDGVHYLTIARDGYFAADLIQAFFPAYPLLMRFLSNFINPIMVGVIISNLSLIGALYFGFLLTRKLFTQQAAKHFMFLLLTFPTSFYLGSVYNEPLFLMLVLAGCWYYATNKKAISGFLMGLSSGVRLVGLILIPAIISSWMLKFKKHEITLKNHIYETIIDNKIFIIGLFFGLTVFAGFILFLWQNYSDPLYFFSVQSRFGAGRQTNLILLPQTFYRSLRILLTARPFDWKYFSYVQDLFISTAFLLGIIFSWKKLKIEYSIFSLLVYLLPTLTGNLSSMPRYMLAIFPVFMWWAQLVSEKPKWQIIYYPVTIALLAINTILFVQGYWVA